MASTTPVSQSDEQLNPPDAESQEPPISPEASGDHLQAVSGVPPSDEDDDRDDDQPPADDYPPRHYAEIIAWYVRYYPKAERDDLVLLAEAESVEGAGKHTPRRVEQARIRVRWTRLDERMADLRVRFKLEGGNQPLAPAAAVAAIRRHFKVPEHVRIFQDRAGRIVAEALQGRQVSFQQYEDAMGELTRDQMARETAGEAREDAAREAAVQLQTVPAKKADVPPQTSPWIRGLALSTPIIFLLSVGVLYGLIGTNRHMQDVEEIAESALRSANIAAGANVRIADEISQIHQERDAARKQADGLLGKVGIYEDAIKDTSAYAQEAKKLYGDAKTVLDDAKKERNKVIRAKAQIEGQKVEQIGKAVETAAKITAFVRSGNCGNAAVAVISLEGGSTGSNWQCAGFTVQCQGTVIASEDSSAAVHNCR